MIGHSHLIVPYPDSLLPGCFDQTLRSASSHFREAVLDNHYARRVFRDGVDPLTADGQSGYHSANGCS